MAAAIQKQNRYIRLSGVAMAAMFSVVLVALELWRPDTWRPDSNSLLKGSVFKQVYDGTTFGQRPKDATPSHIVLALMVANSAATALLLLDWRPRRTRQCVWFLTLFFYVIHFLTNGFSAGFPLLPFFSVLMHLAWCWSIDAESGLAEGLEKVNEAMYRHKSA